MRVLEIGWGMVAAILVAAGGLSAVGSWLDAQTARAEVDRLLSKPIPTVTVTSTVRSTARVTTAVTRPRATVRDTVVRTVRAPAPRATAPRATAPRASKSSKPPAQPSKPGKGKGHRG